MHRRSVLAGLALAPFSGALLQGCAASPPRLPVRAITRGPGFHWFGYYDKLQFDPTGRYALGMSSPFENRSPTGDDVIEIGVIDLHDDDRWQPIGTSRAWCWQQGCMLQWVPGSDRLVIWNDRDPQGRQFVSRLHDLRTGQTRTLPRAIYALSPDGRWAAGLEFSRLESLRPGYGYAGVPDAYFDIRAPADIGLYRMDLATGDSRLLYTLAQAAALPHRGRSVADNFHWFNHILVNPDGTRLTFLHRWRRRRESRQIMALRNFRTRMLTLNPDGSDPFVIDPSGHTSHFVWRDPTTICAYTRPIGQQTGFHFLTDRTGEARRIATDKMPDNGHQSFLPGRNQDWLVNDNYATHRDHRQIPYLYRLSTDERFDLGAFPQGLAYRGEWRCDLHPRVSPDANMICIDSAHGGRGRQMYVIDLRPFWDWLGQ